MHRPHALILIAFPVIAAPLFADPMNPGGIVLQDGLAIDLLEEPEDTEDHPALRLPTAEGEPGGFIQESIIKLQDESLIPKPLNTPSSKQTSMLETLINNRQWSQAFRLSERASFDSPDNMNLLRTTAALAAMAREYERAHLYFGLYLGSHPEDISSTIAHAQVLLFMKKYRLAEHRVALVLRQAPTHLMATYTQSCLDHAQGNPAEADEQDFWLRSSLINKVRMAHVLAGDREPLTALLGPERFVDLCARIIGEASHEHLEIIPDTLSTLRQAVARSEWARVVMYYELANSYGVEALELEQHAALAYFRIGNYSGAERIMRELVRTTPNLPELWYRLGYIQIEQKRYQDAVDSFRRAVALAPDFGQFSFAYGTALLSNNQDDEAWRHLRKVAESNPEGFRSWVAGDQPYLGRIRNDQRYTSLPSDARVEAEAEEDQQHAP